MFKSAEMLARKQRTADRKDEGFRTWLEEPMVKLSLTMVPQSDPPEVLRQLLRSAYDSGFGAGGADIAIDLMESIMKKDGERRE